MSTSLGEPLIDLTDMETCYALLKIDFGRSLDIQENRFGLEPEIVAKFAATHARIYEVPISYQGRTYSEGKKITWKDGVRTIFSILKYFSPWEKKRTAHNFLKIMDNK